MGSCEAKVRSTPDKRGLLRSTHKQDCPRSLRAVQQASLGGIGLKGVGVTAALHGVSSRRALMKDLAHPWPTPCSTMLAIKTINTSHIPTLVVSTFMASLNRKIYLSPSMVQSAWHLFSLGNHGYIRESSCQYAIFPNHVHASYIGQPILGGEGVQGAHCT